MEAKSRLYKNKYSNPEESVVSGSNLRYFDIEKKRQEIHRLLNMYDGSFDSVEVIELAREFDDAMIELYQRK
ncbi:hypothetical protein [Clostridium sp. KNHs205]|uniref:hypothetical protein n=1 Tax=Clostridium sp. KNHs205 TaxID=1449050 RepID=UPI00051B9DAD|nr:hypothetical protein [Clostridium sp. KNHs205]